MMLVRLNPLQNRAEVVNIPRDTLVELPGGDEVRINAAYRLGGAALSTQVVASLLKIPRPYFVTINLKSFEQIVDTLGGVTLTVDRHYVYSDPYQDLEIDIKAGTQHMDGETALKFVRIRYDDVTNDDIGRIHRQQQFLEALREKLSNPMYLLKIPDLIRTTRRHITTNVPEQDQLDLAEALFRARNQVTMITLPGYPDDETGAWELDRDEWVAVKRTWDQP